MAYTECMNRVSPGGGLLGMARYFHGVSSDPSVRVVMSVPVIAAPYVTKWQRRRGKRLCALLLLGLVFMMVGVAASAEPDVSGQEIASIEDDAISEEELVGQQQLIQQAEAIQRQLEQLRAGSSTYSPALIEIHQDLGRTYMELQQYDDAQQYLLQALQLMRVNDGLYSAGQVRVLEELIKANEGLEAWEEVDDYQHLLFLVRSRLHEAGSEEHVDALLALSRWRIQAARYGLLARGGAPFNVSLLQEMQYQQDAALGSARERGHVRQQWDVLYTQALTDIEVVRQLNQRGLMEFAAMSEPRYVTRTVCRTVPDGDGARQVCWNQTVNNPDYYRSAQDERRGYLERARSRIQGSLRELEALLVENPEFASKHQAEAESGIQALQDVATQLQREARRSVMHRW